MGAPRLVRILLVDDHNLFRQGLVLLLRSRPDIQVVGEAEDGQRAIQLARELSPDLILMDVHMPVCDGIRAVREIKREMPQINIVMLSASDDDDDLFEAIKAGADGYLLKDLDPSQFLDEIDGLAVGEAPISGVLADRILHAFRKESHKDSAAVRSGETLTSRELRTLELVVAGCTNLEIADAMHISKNTVKLYLRTIMEKLHLQNRVQIAVYAVRQGLDHALPDK